MHLFGNVNICHTQMKCVNYEFITAFQIQDTHLSRIKIYRPFMLNETFKLIFSSAIIPFKKTTPIHLNISILLTSYVNKSICSVIREVLTLVNILYFNQF